MFRTHCNRQFVPGGKDAIIAAVLIGIIGACGLYTYQRIDRILDEGIPVTVVANTQCHVDLDEAHVPAHQVLSGGVPKDGIPALTSPKMISLDQVSFLDEDERVIGFTMGRRSFAYPLRIMASHECVNDSYGDVHFAVIYCPLCDSVSVFNREIDGDVLEFGISGQLYQSNVLLYDRQDDPSEESLWSQMYGKSVAGPRKGTELETFPHELVTWKTWKQQYPDSNVLSLDTGYSRSYPREFYANYFASPNLMFPVYDENQNEKYETHEDDLLLLKDVVIGVRKGNHSRVYPVEYIQFETSELQDDFWGSEIVLSKNANGEVFIQVNENIDVYHSFWFAWKAFHPNTEIYSGPGFDLEAWKKMKHTKI